MIAKILQRMNRRERILAGAVALVVFFLANLFVWSWLFRAAGDSRVEVVTRKQKHAEQTVCCVRPIFGRTVTNGCANISRRFMGRATPRPCLTS